MKTSILCVLLIFLLQVTFSQIPESPNKVNTLGKRIGQWTVLYDTNWNVISEKKNTVYYRIINYSNGDPLGKVKDYFKSGKIQSDFELVSEDPVVYADGIAIWYYESGNKAKEMIFKNGKLNGKVKIYYKNGQLWTEYEYKDNLLWNIFCKYNPQGKPLKFGTLKDGSGSYIDYNESGQKAFECNFVDGIKVGKYTEFYENEKKKMTGSMVNDQKNGTWKEWDEDGKLTSESNYVNDKINGTCINYYSDGAKKNEGSYVDGLKIGIWSEFNTNGTKLEEGSYLNGEKEGLWKEYYELAKNQKSTDLILYKPPLNLGEVRGEGLYIKDERTGNWIYYDKNNIKVASGLWISLPFFNKEDTLRGLSPNWINSTVTYGFHYSLYAMNGRWTFWYETGSVKAECDFIKNKKDGSWVSFNSDGRKDSEGTYKSDKKDGLWKDWLADGTLTVANYVDGNIDGEMSIYYPNGRIKVKGKAINNLPLGVWKIYDESGGWEEGIFDNTIREGKWIGYRSDGTKAGEYNYRNNVLTGVCIIYYKEGGWAEGSYINGQMDGIWKVYDKTGKYSHSASFRNGTRID